jgi:hypothetical protein
VRRATNLQMAEWRQVENKITSYLKSKSVKVSVDITIAVQAAEQYSFVPINEFLSLLFIMNYEKIRSAYQRRRW